VSFAERVYRAALSAYPAEYRAERGDEVLGTLLEATEGRRGPDVREVGGLLADGYRRRVLASVTPAHGALRAGAAWAALALATLTAAVAGVGIVREDHLAASLPPALAPHLHVLGLALSPWFAAFAITAVGALAALAASARRTALGLSVAGALLQVWEAAFGPGAGFAGAHGHLAVYAWTNVSTLPREPWHWLVPSLLLPTCILLAGSPTAPRTGVRAARMAAALVLAAGLTLATDHLYGGVAGLAIVLVPLLAVAVAVSPLDPRPAFACVALLATALPLAWTFIHADPTTPAAGDLTVLAGIGLGIVAFAAAGAASARGLRGPAPPHGSMIDSTPP
jgi:hypothetical protein